MARKPSVTFVNRVYPPVRGATGRVLRDLAVAFVKDGWDVSVLTTGDKTAEEFDGPIRIIRVKAPLKSKTVLAYMNVWIRLFLKGMKLKAPDLFISMTDPPLLVTAVQHIAKKKGSKHIHWCQDLFPDILPALGIKLSAYQRKFLKKRSVRAMKACDKIVAVGRDMGKLLTHSGIEAPKIAVIPNWPDRELVSDKAVARKRKALNVKNARPFDELLKKDAQSPRFRVLYAGNMGRAHPIRPILYAAEKLSVMQPDIEFVFIGDGHNYQRLVKERTKKGLDNLRFLPYQPVDSLRDVMQSGDLHLVTMRKKAAGMLVPSKFYSAIAVQRPCVLVGPQNCEVADVIRDFECGSVVDQGDVKALVETIIAYRKDSEKWLKAYEGAQAASKVFVPDESLNAWLSRARDIVGVSKRVSRRRPAPKKASSKLLRKAA